MAFTIAVNDLPQLWMLDLDQPNPDPVRLDAVGDLNGPLAALWGPALMGVWSPAGGQVAVRRGGVGPGAASSLGVIDVANPGTIRDLGLISAGLFPWFDQGERIWSPTGDRLVSVEYSDASLWVVNVDGSGGTRVMSGQGMLGEPSWSADGTHVGTSAWDNAGVGRILATPADSEAPRELGTDFLRWGPAGSQAIVRDGENRWAALDLEADVRESIAAPAGTMPNFSGDGAWLLTPGAPAVTVRRRGCGDPIALAGVGDFAYEGTATADGNHFAFGDTVGDGARLWVADRVGDTWETRLLYTPTTPMPRADWPIASVTGSRIAWVLGGNDTDRFLVTHDGVRDPVEVVAPDIGRVLVGTYWFSPDLRRLAYLTNNPGAERVRVLDISDPNAPALLGELADPDGRPIKWVSWSRSGNALGYAVWEQPIMPPIVSDLFVTRIAAGALETPRFLGRTLNQAEVSFHWEP